jgi:hypothetical protein
MNYKCNYLLSTILLYKGDEKNMSHGVSNYELDEKAGVALNKQWGKIQKGIAAENKLNKSFQSFKEETAKKKTGQEDIDAMFNWGRKRIP